MVPWMSDAAGRSAGDRGTILWLRECTYASSRSDAVTLPYPGGGPEGGGPGSGESE